MDGLADEIGGADFTMVWLARPSQPASDEGYLSGERYDLDDST